MVFFFPYVTTIQMIIVLHYTYFFAGLQQNFKWEEQNYVVQNEINNLSFLVKNDLLSKVSHVYEATFLK